MGASTRYPDEFHILVFPRPTNAAESLPAQAPAAVSIPTSGRDKSGVCPGLRVPAELRIEGPARLLIALSGSCFIFVHGRFMRSLHHATPDRLRHAIRQAHKQGPKWARCIDVFRRAAIKPIGGTLSKEDRIRRLMPLFEQAKTVLLPYCTRTIYDGSTTDLVPSSRNTPSSRYCSTPTCSMRYLASAARKNSNCAGLRPICRESSARPTCPDPTTCPPTATARP